jgi:Zn-dependent peptidase ImmA (M78 family)/DNA-binding XRE family transcriptional regulator
MVAPRGLWPWQEADVAGELKIRPELLGARLRSARSNAGMTQDAASKATGITRTTIAAMETGKRSVDVKQLRTFAELYQVAEVELLGDDRQPLDLEVNFRSGSGPELDKAKAAVAVSLTRLASGALELETIVSNRPAKQDYPVVHLEREGDIEQQAEDAALLLRQRFGLGLGPIPNLLSVLESDLGLRIFERPLASGISGAVAYDVNCGGFIILNSNHPIERRLNTAAHECAHPLLRKPGVAVLGDHDKLEDREERFCDAFGRALLMPASSVRRKHAELRDVSGKFTVRHILAMALYFVVSVEAMTRRMESLGLVLKGMHDSLREKGLTSAHTRAVQSEVAAPPVPQFTPHSYFLAGAAVDRELLSVEQVAKLLDIGIITTRRLVRRFSSEGEGLLDFRP